MKNLLILIVALTTGIFAPVFAETLNYTIRHNGSEMVIVPYGYSQPVIQKSIYKIEVQPFKSPFYQGKKLPRGKNKIYFV